MKASTSTPGTPPPFLSPPFRSDTDTGGSLLTLGTVIGTLAENAARNKHDHVPFRNSKLTRMLQPSLAGNARISVICTINPDAGAVAETTSTLLFAQRIKRVQLNATKKEVVDTEALLERYRKEIDELRKRLAEKEAEAPALKRRLSAREVGGQCGSDLCVRWLIRFAAAIGRVEGDERPQLAYQAAHEAHPDESDG